MASISSISNSTNYQVTRVQTAYGSQPRPTREPAEKAGEPREEHTGLVDPRKLQQLSDLLDMDTKDVSSAATSASSLIALLMDKGVDFTEVRKVLNQTGDLLDVSA